MFGPAVRRKRFCRSVGIAVLHQCIRPLLVAACAPGHHGYQRACVLISGLAIRVTRVRTRREDRSSMIGHHLVKAASVSWPRSGSRARTFGSASASTTAALSLGALRALRDKVNGPAL